MTRPMMRTSNYEIQKWIGSVLTNSTNHWFISVFKINGSFKDDLCCYRKMINELSLGKFYKAVDWTITTTRRNKHNKNMKFIPFIGGDKESGITTHIHAFIEIPNYEMKWELNDKLKKNFNTMCRHSFKSDVDSDLWLNELDKSQIQKHQRYCLRYEGNTFLHGTEKVLFELTSCLI